MRLERVEISNFKLLENVVLEFSTDRQRPLTAVRAENGSGKTSLLLAMLWGFYGRRGLPRFATDARLTSTAQPIGATASVRVMIEFEYEGPGGRGRYRLIRSCEETPTGIDDDPRRTPEVVAAYRITDAGEEPIANPEVFLRQVVPGNLRDIFFTNGDDVQEFMSGKVDRTDRTDRVHLAIKALLGLDQLYVANKDIADADRRFRRELSKEGGSDLAAAAKVVEQAEVQRDEISLRIGELENEISRIRDKRNGWEQQLREITDIGDLNQINAELLEIETQLNYYARERDKELRDIREELSSEGLSWALIPEQLEKGMAVLESMADRGLIPGTSIEVIRDRLLDSVCFCGTPLDPGSPARERLEHLLSEHSQIDRSKELLTAAYHGARFQKLQHDAAVENQNSFSIRRAEILGAFADVSSHITARTGKRAELRERRGRIDESRVTTLTADIASAEADLAKRDREQAVRKYELQNVINDLQSKKDELEKLNRKATLSDARKSNALAAADLAHLVGEVIRDLEVDHVQRVATIMSARFLDIVGSDPEIDSAIFGSVSINESFDIEVRTPQGTRLDFDAEINGASQRALTLSLIWALMEVAEVEAPRIIDTPLGMVAGAVKTRLTDAITAPPPEGGPNYQVILLLTRSEIRDVESIIDERAGLIRTMSCSKDSKDLRFPWGLDHPQVKVCTCTHRQSCRICARTYDSDDQIEFRDIEAVAS
jgi:DNA sulfur modification protein DndD